MKLVKKINIDIKMKKEDFELIIESRKEIERAIDYVSVVAFKNKDMRSRDKLQRSVYSRLREDYKLSSQMCVNVPTIVARNYSKKTDELEKPLKIAVEDMIFWNKKDYSILKNEEISISTGGGRVKGKILNFLDYESLIIKKWKLTSGRVFIKDNEKFIISMEISLSKQKSKMRLKGVKNIISVNLVRDMCVYEYDAKRGIITHDLNFNEDQEREEVVCDLCCSIVNYAHHSNSIIIIDKNLESKEDFRIELESRAIDMGVDVYRYAVSKKDLDTCEICGHINLDSGSGRVKYSCEECKSTNDREVVRSKLLWQKGRQIKRRKCK